MKETTKCIARLFLATLLMLACVTPGLASSEMEENDMHFSIIDDRTAHIEFAGNPEDNRGTLVLIAAEENENGVLEPLDLEGIAFSNVVHSVEYFNYDGSNVMNWDLPEIRDEGYLYAVLIRNDASISFGGVSLYQNNGELTTQGEKISPRIYLDDERKDEFKNDNPAMIFSVIPDANNLWDGLNVAFRDVADNPYGLDATENIIMVNIATEFDANGDMRLINLGDTGLPYEVETFQFAKGDYLDQYTETINILEKRNGTYISLCLGKNDDSFVLGAVRMNPIDAPRLSLGVQRVTMKEKWD